MLPTPDTRLCDWPWVVIRFRCSHCDRGRDVRLATCAAKFGANITIGELEAIFQGNCPRAPEFRWKKPAKYSWKCTGYVDDIGSSRPPDLPNQVVPLRLVEGGRKAKA
jgi:hypothetical protein